MHTEKDRQAHQDHIESKLYQIQIARWLSDNPEIGCLNGGIYYRIDYDAHLMPQVVTMAAFEVMT